MGGGTRMTAADWAGLFVSIISIATAFAFSIRFLVKHYLSELKPDGNGGHNFEGRVRRIEDKIDEIYSFLIRKTDYDEK